MTNNEYVVQKFKEIIDSYIIEWKDLTQSEKELLPMLESLQEINNFLNEKALFLIQQESNPATDEDFINRIYLPELKPVIEYSILYEFEDLLLFYQDEFGSSFENSEETMQALDNSWSYLLEALNTWFSHKYGYSLMEFEDELRSNKQGVFAGFPQEALDTL